MRREKEERELQENLGMLSHRFYFQSTGKERKGTGTATNEGRAAKERLQNIFLFDEITERERREQEEQERDPSCGEADRWRAVGS